MKKLLLLLIILAALTGATAQTRGVARGADPGELYITTGWYGIYTPGWGPPFYDTMQLAIFRLTENGKNLTIQYDADAFAGEYTPPDSIILNGSILADATPGVVYIRRLYVKDSYSHTSLWVSFDYGKNWTFREENIGQRFYYAANFEGLIYRIGGDLVDGTLVSDDYGATFTEIYETAGWTIEPYFERCEFFAIAGTTKSLYHTHDCAATDEIIPIDSQFVFGSMSGILPDVYRGGLPGEVYISSWFPDWTYKVSFSADTGHTFQHVYINEPVDPVYDYNVNFMSDREPDVFYIIKYYDVEDTDPWGKHRKICVDYYRDYGDTFVDTYCHDITKDYKNEVGIALPSPPEGGDVRVYPNPTEGEFQVTSYGLQVTDIEMFDVFGKTVGVTFAVAHVETDNYPSLQPTTTINISHLPSGIYFIRIQTTKGLINRKIVKY